MNESKRVAEIRQLIESNGGQVSPADIVDFARNPKTALHRAFNWDDTTAAEAWRIEQAKKILRVSVVMIARPDNGNMVRVRAFISPCGDGERGYQYTPKMIETVSGRAAILQAAFAEFEAFRAKYEWLEELMPLFEAGKKIKQKGKTP